MDKFWDAPPITRTIAAATFVTSLLVHVRVLPYVGLFYQTGSLIKFPPELWRLFSSFILTGGIGIILDPYFIFQYGGSLERRSPRFSPPGDFLVYVAFVWAIILLANAIVLGGFIFTQAFVLALAYTYAQDNRGTKVWMIVISIPVEWLPWAMLLITFLSSSPHDALVQGSGLIAAHLYDFLTRLYPTFGNGKNYIQTPGFVRRWFGGQTVVNHRGYGTAYMPRTGNSQGARASSSGFSAGLGGVSNLWNSRGQGRRLGGE